MTKDDFISWKSSRVTQEILKHLEVARNEHVHDAAMACIGVDEAEKIALKNALNCGVVLGLNYLLEIEWKDLGGYEFEDDYAL